MHYDHSDEAFSLGDAYSSPDSSREALLDAEFDFDCKKGEEDDELWGNNYDHYDSIAAERRLVLQIPDQIRPVQDHPVVLVKFGHQELVWQGHKLKFEGEYPRFYRCNGDGCYACKGDGKLIDWQLEFFLETRSQKVAYLAFKKSSKPGSLAAVLREAFAGGFPAVLSLQKSGMYNYNCSRINPAAGLDFRKDVIREFLDMLKADEIDFDELVPSVTNTRMLDAEGIGEKLAVLGIRE